MPPAKRRTWGEIEKELLANKLPNGMPDFDGVRRKYLADLAAYTKRPVIAYETTFSPPQGAGPSDVSISLDPDVGAFMEVVNGLPTDKPLDLILHSPGGTAEAAEAIVDYLRGRFDGLRVIVPVAAMSAATMMSMAADEIVLGSHSQLGPIDPQITIQTPEGPRSAPAAAIKEQFKDATADLAQHPEHTGAWLPILRSMAPALLRICDDSAKLAKDMVIAWLTKYMLKDEADAGAAAEQIADKLSAYDELGSHARRLNRDQLRTFGPLKIVDLEADQELQDRVLAVHHAINHTMNHTGAVKLVENNLGRAFVRRIGGVIVPVPGGPGGPPGIAGPGPAPQLGKPAGNRGERRRQARGRG